MDVVSAVGSGDALLAGVAAGTMRGSPLAEAVRLGVAVGAANATRVGAGLFDAALVEPLLARVGPAVRTQA